jgi:hypothetical protein
MTHMINPQISSSQKFLIIGTILGGSSIIRPKKGKNCYMSMRDKNLSWLKFKADQLKNLTSQSPLTIEKTNRWHSVCYPVFNEYHQMFYKGKDRILRAETLNLLHDSSIAIWFGDSGKCKDDCVVLNTNIWGKKGTERIVEYFDTIDWKAEIFLERKNYRVILDKPSSKDFLKLISPYLPKERKCGQE